MSLLLLFGRGAQSLARTSADSFATSDAVIRAMVLSRAPTDAVTVSDASTRSAVLARSIAQSLTLSDATVGSRSYQRTVTDAVHFAERVLETLLYSADNLTISDAVTRTQSLVRSTVDTLTSSDAPVRAVIIARAITDALAASDAVTRSGNFLRGTWEGASDNFNRSDVDGWGVPVSGGPAWQWVINPATYANTNGTGNIVATDSTTVRLAFLPWPASLEHDVSVTWTSDKTVSGASQQPRVLPRVISEQIYYRLRVDWKTSGQIELLWEMFDEVSVSVLAQSGDLFSRSVSDVLNIRAAATGANPTTLQGKAWIGATEPAWQLQTTDSTPILQDDGGIGLQFRTGSGTSNWPVTASFDDMITTGAISITDTTSRAMILARALSDSLTITDAGVGSRVFARTTPDSLTLADATTRAQALARAISQTLTITDTPTRQMAIARSIADTLALTDAATRASSRHLTTSDALTFTDSAGRTASIHLSASDLLAITDAVSTIFGLLSVPGYASILLSGPGVLLSVIGNLAAAAVSGPGVTKSVTGTGATTSVRGPGVVVNDG